MSLLQEFLVKAAERRAKGHCPTCNRPIKTYEFRDQISHREFGISGLCQSCQDRVFGPGKEIP